MRNFIIVQTDIATYQPSVELPYFNMWHKIRNKEHLFAANIIHTTINILEKKYNKLKIVPLKIIDEYLDTGITLNEFYNTISNLLEIIGYNRNMPLTGQKRITNLENFRASIRTYIQECCPDNKQHHIFGKQYYGNGLRLNHNEKYYRPNLFSCPESWEWFNQDHTRWFPCCNIGTGVIPKKCPTFIKYFRPSEIKNIPNYCKMMTSFYNKSAILGVRSNIRK